jgi:hypothetical protein
MDIVEPHDCRGRARQLKRQEGKNNDRSQDRNT